MRASERLYANYMVQFTSLLFLFLYLYFTYDAYPRNVLWTAAALLLGLFGWFRPVRATLLASLTAMLGYGAYTLFRAYAGPGESAAGWNELIWLLAFPFFALIGNLNRGAETAAAAPPRNISRRRRQEREEAAAAERMAFDEALDYSDLPGFSRRLELELEDASRSMAPFSLLLAEIQHYWDYKLENGYETTAQFLQSAAEAFGEALPDVGLKGYLGGGRFAFVIPETEWLNPTIAEIRINNKYNAMLLSKPRREAGSRIRLRFGAAAFPEHAADAEGLIVRARQELDMNTGVSQ